MKKFIAFLVLALLIAAGPSFALSCKEGNYGSDECWTNVRISPLETRPITQGVVLVADFSDDNADDAAYQVRAADASADGAHVIGVAQGNIATGDRGVALVRGQGKIRVKTNNTYSSGDMLFVSTSADATTSIVTGNKPVAFALAAQTASGNTSATKDAYIVIV